MVANEANCVNYEYRAPFQPGLAFFKLLVDAAIRGQPQKHLKYDGSATKLEIPSFPVRIPPTLLRVAANGSDADSQPFRVVLLVTHEAVGGSATELSTSSSAANNEDFTCASPFVLFVQMFTTERQYREQRKVLLRLFIPDQQLHTATRSVLAVSKHASDTNCKSNATFLLRSAEDIEIAIDRLWNGTLTPDYQQGRPENTSDSGFSCAIQKYVPFKGASPSSSSLSPASTTTNSSTSSSRKAWLARPVYRKKDHASWIWILTDSANSEMTNSTSHDSCQLVKCIAAQSWTAPRLIASTSSHFFENLLHVSIAELGLDLIQDNDGRWWLLQVKAFQLRRQQPRPSSATSNASATVDQDNRVKSAPNRLEGSGSLTLLLHKKWRCAGQYCSDHGETPSYNNNTTVERESSLAPSGYLTKKVLLSCDFYEKYMTQSDMSVTSGFANFSAALSFHLQHQVSKRDRNQLYESQPLCTNCVTKYHFIREQWIDATTTTNTAKQTVVKARKKGERGGLNPPAVNAPPRLLPSLQSASTSALVTGVRSTLPVMKSSYSAPAIQLEAQQRTSFQQSRSVDHQQLKMVPERPEYLSEMDKIEEMLTEHDAKFASIQSKKELKDIANLPLVRDDHSNEEDEDDQEANQFSRYLQKRSEADSVEEMWKSISFRPMSTTSALSTTATAATTGVESDRRPGVQYNSYSLKFELDKQLQTNFDMKSQLESQSSHPTHHHQGSSPSGATVSVHTIAISSCKQVFYDEAYRERIVNEAKEFLFQQNQSVRLVIVPNSIPQQVFSSGKDDSNGIWSQQQSHLAAQEDDDEELAEMALRTLFLDLSQSAATDRITASLWKMPAIARESSGCTTMLLTASN